jgi:hypothetical protein
VPACAGAAVAYTRGGVLDHRASHVCIHLLYISHFSCSDSCFRCVYAASTLSVRGVACYS